MGPFRYDGRAFSASTRSSANSLGMHLWRVSISPIAMLTMGIRAVSVPRALGVSGCQFIEFIIEMTSKVTKRHLEILDILVADYIASAQPVGSRAIARKHYGHLSSATVRNVMADLAELGLISQPHVSAGRIPTTQSWGVLVPRDRHDLFRNQ